MKKLNKLLMPIVGLSTIVAIAAPLAACNKNKYIDGVEVTEDEWNYALAYLSGIVDDVKWQSTGDDEFIVTTYESDGKISEKVEFVNIHITDDNGTMDGVITEQGKTRNAKAVSIAKNHMYFTYVNDNDEKAWECEEGISKFSLFEQSLIIAIASLGGQQSFKFDNQNRTYDFSGDYKFDDVNMHSDIKIKFDSNKKITYIDYNTTAFDEGKPAETFALELHPQYENVTVDVPQELITRVNERIFDMSSRTKDFTLPTIYHEGVIVNITADAAYKTISAKDKRTSGGTAPDANIIYLNDKLLIENKDYTVSYSEASKERVVTFTKGIAKDDKISIAFGSFDQTSTTLTVTLA